MTDERYGRLTLIDENKLVRTSRFAGDWLESEGTVESVCIWAISPQPQAGEVTSCRTHDRTYELRSDPPPSMIHSDIEMANSANCRIVEVRVTV